MSRLPCCRPYVQSLPAVWLKGLDEEKGHPPPECTQPRAPPNLTRATRAEAFLVVRRFKTFRSSQIASSSRSAGVPPTT
jgi:hypothetical protein